MVSNRNRVVTLAVAVAALGYFVDIYDLILFSTIRVASLKSLGVTEKTQLIEQGQHLLNWQMFGMLWLVDSLVPLVYQSVVMSPPPLHMALLLGFFPALIITSTIFFSHNRPIQTSRHAL